MEVAQARVGVVKGAWVLAFMVEWQQARDALGAEWPEQLSEQVRAHAEWSKRGERTIWREIERFRAVWPDEQSPSRLMDEAMRSWDRASGAAGLASIRLAA